MGGKSLKFPKRQKYRPYVKREPVEEKPITEEEHKKRLDYLKSLGVIKK